MKILPMFALALLAALPTLAAAAPDCAVARDPGRCEAQRAALKACADARGAEKRACLDAALPPVDCSKASDPERCEKTQKSRAACNTKTGKELKKCLRDEAPKTKKPKARKPAAPKI